jgi:hypothetical protein
MKLQGADALFMIHKYSKNTFKNPNVPQCYIRAHSHCKPSWAEPNLTRLSWTWPDRAEPSQLSDYSHCMPSQPKLKAVLLKVWTVRMSNQVHVFSLIDNIWWRSLLFSRKRRFWVHNISSRRESYDEFHNLLDDLLKDEERFWRYFRMSTDTFKYILELIHTSIKKQNTNFQRSISPEERLMVMAEVR